MPPFLFTTISIKNGQFELKTSIKIEMEAVCTGRIFNIL